MKLSEGNRRNEEYRNWVVIAFVQYVAFGLITGLYLPALSNHDAVFLFLDVLFNALAPILAYFLLRKYFDFDLATVGLRPVIDTTTHFLRSIASIGLFVIANWLLFKISWALLWRYDWIASSAFSYKSLFATQPVLHSVVVVYLSVTAGFFEEVFFRGLLLHLCNMIWENGTIVLAVYVLFSGVLFGVVHWEGGLAKIVALSLLGSCAAALYLKFKNLWPLVIGHTAADFIFISAAK